MPFPGPFPRQFAASDAALWAAITKGWEGQPFTLLTPGYVGVAFEFGRVISSRNPAVSHGTIGEWSVLVWDGRLLLRDSSGKEQVLRGNDEALAVCEPLYGQVLEQVVLREPEMTLELRIGSHQFRIAGIEGSDSDIWHLVVGARWHVTATVQGAWQVEDADPAS